MSDDKIEERFYNLGVRIAAYEEQVLAIKNNVESLFVSIQPIQETKKSVDDLSNCLSLTKKNINDYVSIFLDKNTIFDKKISEIFDLENKLQEAVSYLSNFVKDLGEKLQKLEENSRCIENLCKQSDLQKNNYINLNQFVNVLSEEFSKNQNKFQIGLQNLSSKHEIFDSKLQDLSNALVSLQEKIDLQNKSIEDVKNRSSKEFDDKLYQQKIDFEKKLFEIKNATPVVEKESIAQSLVDNIELIKHDSENSLIKSSNNDMRINFLEKKIENIFLLLKQYELSK
jgi:prefoldin subunit 5